MLSLGNKLTLNTQPIYKFVNKYSIDFDGVDDRIITDGADTVLQNTTYSFWCKSSTTTANQGVFGHGASAIGGFHFNGDGTRPLLYLAGATFRYWNDTPAQDDGEWHHWVLYLDTDINNSKLYVDGVLQTPSYTISNDPPQAYTESLTIGSDRQVGGNSFEGKIDEFAVYDRELTQAEITRMYNTYYSPNRVANGNFAQEGVEEVTNGDFSQIGSEQVTNGDFATDSNWLINGTFEITNGRLHCISDGSFQYAGQGSVFEVGKTYKLTFDIVDYTSGSIRVRPSGQSPFNTYNANGTYTEYITATDATLLIERNSACDLYIDNVSVKEVGQDWTADSNWTIDQANNKAISDGSQSGNVSLRQSNSIMGLTTGSFYKVEFTISNYSAGQINPHVRGNASGNVNGNGVKTSYIAAGSGSDGINLYSNLDFAGDISNISVKEVGQHWTFNTGWSTDGTKAIFTATGSYSNLQQAGAIIGRTYKITFDATRSAGTLYVKAGSNGTFTAISSDGSYNISSVAAGDTNFYFQADTTFAGTVDNIVVQELKHDATNLMLNAGAYQSANPLITSTKSMEFDGGDNYLKVTNAYGSFTGSFSFWVNRDNNTGYQFLYDARGTGGTGTGYAYASIGIDVISVSSGTVYVDGVATTTVPTDGNWHNVVITGITLDVTEDIKFASSNVVTNLLNGKMTEVGVWDRTLTALEVASLYNQGMPTNLLVNRNNYQSGNPTVFNTKQVDFDGTDDHLKANSTLGSFTGSISAWIKRDSLSESRYITDFRSGSGVGYFAITGSHAVAVSSGTAYVDNVATTTVPQDNEWHHIVVTGITLDITESIIFGSRYNIIDVFDGEMSQIGLWNSTLTADEVSSLYNHGLPIDLTTNQAAYASSSNLVGYWRMGSGTLDTYPLIADQTNATLGSELLSQPVDLQTDFINNSGGVIVDADTFTTAGGTLDGIVTSISLTIGKTYKLTVEGNTTSSGFTFGSANGTGREYGSGFGTHYFTALHANIWVRQSTAGTTNITSFTLKQVQGNPAIMINLGGGADFSDGIKNGSPYANIVQDSDFTLTGTQAQSTNGTYWDTGAGWTIANNKATSNGTVDNLDGISLETGKNYKATVTVSNMTTGNLSYRLGGASSNEILSISSNGEYTAYGVAGGTVLRLRSQNGFDGSVTNITISEVNTGLQGYWKMGDGTNDEYPVIYDQVDTTTEAITVRTPSTQTYSVNNVTRVNDDSANSVSFTSTTSGSSYALGYMASAGLLTSNLAVGVYKLSFTVSTSGTTFEYKTMKWYNTGTTFTATNIVEGQNTIYGIINSANNNSHFNLSASAIGQNVIISNITVDKLNGNGAFMTNMLKGNITNQYPLTKIRNYYRMGDGILDGYPIIQDQTSPNLAHIPTTNLATYSEDFSQSYWVKSASQMVLASSITDPFGTQKSYKLQTLNCTNQSYSHVTITSVVGKKYSFSVYAKKGDYDYVSLVGLNPVTIHYFNLANGTATSSGGITPRIYNVGNGWYRCEVTLECDNTSKFFGIYLAGDSGDISLGSVADGNGLYVTAAQVEEQSQATAYLKSDGIAAVRKSSTTNLVTYSETGTYGSAPASSTNVIAPDGTNTAVVPVPSAGSNRYEYNIAANTYASGTVLAFSWYSKQISTPSQSYVGNLNNQAATNLTFGSTTKIETSANGFDRFQIIFTITNGASLSTIRLYFGDVIGVGNSSVAYWGHQLEQQTQAETYAPTYGLPVTIDLFTENNYGTMTNMSASDIVEDTP